MTWANRGRFTKPARPHYHKDSTGVLRECYHRGKSVLTDYGFWIGMFVGWPLEHWLYTQVWPFSLVGTLIGMDSHG